MKVVNTATGEEMEFDTSSSLAIRNSWLEIQNTIKALERAKDKLKPLAQALEGQEIDGYMFKVIPVQRMTYDKAVLRAALDEDTFDLFMVPDKTAIDTYLKDNLESLGEASSIIRKGMIPVGQAYTQTKLEKL